jgi:phosphotransferase system IIA component
MCRSYHEQRKTVVMGDVYFIKVGDYYKIGATRHLYSRIHGLQLANPMPIEVIAHIKSSDMHKTERLFQALFERDDKLERGEWFKLTDTDIAYIKAGRYSKSIVDSIGDANKPLTMPDLIAL